MAGQAGYKAKIAVSTDGGTTWLELPATSPSFDLGGDVIDVTELKTNVGYRSRILGLHDYSISADSKYLAGEPGLVAVRDAKLNRTELDFRMLPDGSVLTDGWSGKCVVESYNFSADVGGESTVAISLQGNGNLTALS